MSLEEARREFRNDPDSDGLTLGEAFEAGWRAALAVQDTEEPEWEYGIGSDIYPGQGAAHPEEFARWLAKELEPTDNFKPRLVRRRKAGPWEAVEPEGETDAD